MSHKAEVGVAMVGLGLKGILMAKTFSAGIRK